MTDTVSLGRRLDFYAEQSIPVAARALRAIPLEATDMEDATIKRACVLLRDLGDTLKKLRLAEHPADNDDPATAEWLLTLPGAKRIDAFAVEVAGDGWRISLLHGQAGEFWFAQGRGIWPGRPVTRGMVRRLMAALN